MNTLSINWDENNCYYYLFRDSGNTRAGGGRMEAGDTLRVGENYVTVLFTEEGGVICTGRSGRDHCKGKYYHKLYFDFPSELPISVNMEIVCAGVRR